MIRSRAALAGLVACGVALAGCTPAPAGLPDSVTVSVFQNRFDYGIRQLELKVSNGTDAPLTVTRASFESSRFTSPAVWERPQVIPAGAARDLKVLLGEARCTDAEHGDFVDLEFTRADGATGTARVVPVDDTGRLDVISAEDCLGAAVARHAAIDGPTRAVWMPGAHRPAGIDISVTPTGADGSATILFATGTVLLGLVDDTGAEVNEQRVGLVADADSGRGVIHLLVVPSRCDPHAVAEDKRGTFFALEVSTSDGLSGRIFVPMSDSVRESLYEFFGDYCGLP